MEMYIAGLILSLSYFTFIYDELKMQMSKDTEEWVMLSAIVFMCLAWPLFLVLSSVVSLVRRFK